MDTESRSVFFFFFEVRGERERGVQVEVEVEVFSSSRRKKEKKTSQCLLFVQIQFTFEPPLESGDGTPRHAALGVKLQESTRDGTKHPVAGADGVGRGRNVGGDVGGGGGNVGSGGSRRRIVRGHS